MGIILILGGFFVCATGLLPVGFVLVIIGLICLAAGSSGPEPVTTPTDEERVRNLVFLITKYPENRKSDSSIWEDIDELGLRSEVEAALADRGFVRRYTSLDYVPSEWTN
jgi:hypothetical protein